MADVSKQDLNLSNYICEGFVQGNCPSLAQCPRIHSSYPYQWQLYLPGFGVYSFPVELSSHIESFYCLPEHSEFHLGQPLNIGDSIILNDLCIDFDLMLARAVHQSSTVEVAVNRLSTASYALPLLAGCQDLESLQCKYLTQWRWYWFHSEDGRWKVFGEDCVFPDQQTLEIKFCSPRKQMNYRFEGPDGLDLIIENNLNKCYMMPLSFVLLNPKYKESGGWLVRRRPLLVLPGTIPRCPLIELLPYTVSFPPNWTPLDRKREWEVVQLCTSSDEYNMVKKAFTRTATSHTKAGTPSNIVKEIFRLQNPFVWQKYVSKQNYMKLGGNADERLLFHGTQKEAVIKGICRHGFDIRCNGVHNTLYGKGAYFAVSSTYSSRYAHKEGRTRNWMFLARVLVGRYALGTKEMTRPPPVDPYRPFDQLYDSCVDNASTPNIFVIFDSDQSYPEYIISFTDSNVRDA